VCARADGWGRAQDVLGTSSSQNWMSMIAGAGPDQHGVYTNGWERGDSVPTPTIMAIWRAQRPTAKIGALYHWGGMGRLIEDDVCDLKVNPGDHFATTDAAVAFIRSDRPDLLFVHLDNIDGAGHATRWGSDTYLEAVAVADTLVGRIVDALAEVGVLGETVVLVSSDHGGNQAGGHGADRSPLRNIPFIVAGPGVAAGRSVTREVRVFDLAATAADLVGLVRPDSWIATPVYEAREAYTPPPPPSSPLAYVQTTQYSFLYDTTDEVNAALPAHSVWRPVAPPGYVSVGDVVVLGYDAPTFPSPVVRDDAEVLAPPAALERVWGNTEFAQYRWPVTYWQPIPSFGYTCVGTHAVVTLPADREPARDGVRCVHTSYLAQAPTGELVARNTGVSTLESGWWVSLWTPAPAAGNSTVSFNSFIVRRDLDGPGYNKYWLLNTDRARAF
jgi:hypothetical protein